MEHVVHGMNFQVHLSESASSYRFASMRLVQTIKQIPSKHPTNLRCITIG